MNIDGSWTDISGINYSDKATSALKLTDIPQSFNNAKYRCIISNDCAVTSNTATLKVITVPVISGNLTYDNNSASPLISTKIILYNNLERKIDSTITNEAGYYVFHIPLNGIYYLKPEFSAKPGGFNPIDALFVNRFFINLYTFGDILKKKAADVNNDASINPSDALMINRRYIALIKSFKIPDWLYLSNPITVYGADINYNIKVICSGDVNSSFKF
jgi:hypothetical protein